MSIDYTYTHLCFDSEGTLRKNSLEILEVLKFYDQLTLSNI